MKWILWLTILELTILELNSKSVWARPPRRNAPSQVGRTLATTPGRSGPQEVEKPLRISGKSRNLSMMLVLKNEKDKVRFANVRRNYKDKIPETKY